MVFNSVTFTPNFSEVGQLISLFRSLKEGHAEGGRTHIHTQGQHGDLTGLFGLLRGKKMG
jgi:hypothetical protein